MSQKRNYRNYVKKYLGPEAVDEKNDPVHAVIASKLLGGIDPKRIPVDEPRLRAILSTRLGELEEGHHKTFIDEANGQRRNHVPEANVVHHNQVVDEVYHHLFPTEGDGPLD